jgi:hypothetical protein
MRRKDCARQTENEPGTACDSDIYLSAEKWIIQSFPFFLSFFSCVRTSLTMKASFKSMRLACPCWIDFHVTHVCPEQSRSKIDKSVSSQSKLAAFDESRTEQQQQQQHRYMHIDCKRCFVCVFFSRYSFVHMFSKSTGKMRHVVYLFLHTVYVHVVNKDETMTRFDHRSARHR